MEKKHPSAKKLLISIGSVFILVLAAVSFIVVPGMVGTGNSTLPPFGYYDNKPIEYTQDSYFMSSVEYYMNANKNAGKTQPSDEFSAFQNAFTSTVLNMAFTQEAEKSGYIVPNSAINRMMKPYFYDENQQYSNALFQQTSDSDKIAIRNYVENSLMYLRFDADVFGSQYDIIGNDPMYGLKTSSKEIDFITEMGKNLRTFDYVAFSMENYPEEEILKWGKEHADLFTKYDMSVISVEDETTATNLLKQLQNNEILFEDAITEYSRNYYSGTDGKLTNSYKHQLLGIITDETSLEKIISLDVGATTDIIQTVNGYSIFKANNTPVEPDFTNEVIINNVKNYMTNKESGIIETYFTNLAKDFANDAVLTGFENACEKYSVEKATTEPMALNYGNNPLLDMFPASDTKLNGLYMDKTFFTEAFALKENGISKPIVLNNNVFIFNFVNQSEAVDASNMYSYYISNFDKYSAQNVIMNSDKVKNNVLQVFLKDIMN